MLKKQLVTLFISCCLASCAGTGEPSEEGESTAYSGRSDCIYEPSIRGYTVLDESNLVVEAAGKRNYHVALHRRAHGLQSSWGIAFKSTSNRVCAGFDEIVFNDHRGGESIRIAAIKELSPADHEYLLIQYGKKEPEIEQAPATREVKGAEVEELDKAAADDSSGN